LPADTRRSCLRISAWRIRSRLSSLASPFKSRAAALSVSTRPPSSRLRSSSIWSRSCLALRTPCLISSRVSLPLLGASKMPATAPTAAPIKVPFQNPRFCLSLISIFLPIFTLGTHNPPHNGADDGRRGQRSDLLGQLFADLAH